MLNRIIAERPKDTAQPGGGMYILHVDFLSLGQGIMGPFLPPSKEEGSGLGSRAKGEELTRMWASSHHPRYKSEAGCNTGHFSSPSSHKQRRCLYLKCPGKRKAMLSATREPDGVQKQHLREGRCLGWFPAHTTICVDCTSGFAFVTRLSRAPWLSTSSLRACSLPCYI